MTLPLIFGLGMTLSFWLAYNLKPRRWRKWSGLLLGIIGLSALIKLPTRHHELFVALGIVTYTGFWLYEECDLFSEDEA
jgi:hypothetical protein